MVQQSEPFHIRAIKKFYNEQSAAKEFERLSKIFQQNSTDVGNRKIGINQCDNGESQRNPGERVDC